jgi:hypothetical protein
LEIDFVLRGAFTGDVDAEHFGTEPRFGQGSCSVAAAQVEHLHARRDAEPSHQRLAAFTHARRDTGEVPLLP